MSFLERLKNGLSKTRDSFIGGVDNILNGYAEISDELYDELEETMILADVGVRATGEILEALRTRVREGHVRDPKACRELLMESIRERMEPAEDAYAYEKEKCIITMLGVNGVGKTTTVGKLAGIYHAEGKHVLIAAADTFRAAANEQLQVWAERAGVDLIGAPQGADPGSVVYDAAAAAKARDVDLLLCDTAGRLHNKKNLMEELAKLHRILDRVYPEAVRENWIVLDATTGQNALVQAREFTEAVPLTGIVLTKMDGTARGGIAIAICAELGVPVKFIGVGEQLEDLQRFDAAAFTQALFS